MANRTLRYIELDKLQGHPENPKAHDAQLIGSSIDRWGYVEPQVLDGRTGLLIAGHGRLERLLAKHAAGEDPPDGVKVRGRKWLVPVVHGWSSADDAEAKGYLVASNQSTIAGGWVPELLGSVLDDVRHSDLGLEGTGYTASSLDELLDSLRPAEPVAPAETAERPPPTPRVSVGDIWRLGEHRMMCGDARDPGHVARLLDGAVVNVAVTSPPYADRRKYDETTEFRPIPPDQYVEWFAPVAANVAAHLADDGSWFVNIKPNALEIDTELYVLDLVLAHVREWGWHFATEFCWERNGIPGRVFRRFKNQFEPIYQFARGDWKIRPEAVAVPSENVPVYNPDDPWVMERMQGEPGMTSFTDRGARPRRANHSTENMTQMQGSGADVGAAVISGLAFPGNRLPTLAGSHEATGHSAAFPVGLPAWFLRAYSDEGDVLFDPFVGSGSSLLAAEQEGRIGYGMELSPGYCDLILDRWEAHDGDTPTKIDG